MATYYERRNWNIKYLGYISWDEYLSSDLWKNIRSKVFSRDKNMCCICSFTANAVHHLDYDIKTLKGENRYNLIAICDKCHNKIEFTDSGKKRFSRKRILQAKKRLIQQYSKTNKIND